MENTEKEEHIFWLDRWTDSTNLLANVGYFKCTATRHYIRIVSAKFESDIKLDIDVNSIQDCKLEYQFRGPSTFVALIVKNRKIVLSPINPFEPNHIIYTNKDEAIALQKVINTIRSNIDPDVNENPYLRQLATKDKLEHIRAIENNWDKKCLLGYISSNLGIKKLRQKYLSKLLFVL